MQLSRYPIRPFLLIALAIGLIGQTNQAGFAEDSLEEALQAVLSVEKHGVGHESAVKAMKTLNTAAISQVPTMLKAMDDANQISANWLRSAVLSAVARGGELPRAEIESFFNDRDHSALGRLLAFELLTDGNEELAQEMIPTFIDDPSLPLRQMAVKSYVQKAKSSIESDPASAIGNLGYALMKARDVSQVLEIAKSLDDLGVKVDLQDQLGFISTWHLVGAFDNKDMQGFDVAYGPEEAIGMIDLNATYKDLEGNETTWKQVTTDHETGNVDLNSYVGKVKGATVYALGSFESTEARDAEIRIGTANATKIWLNGELVMSNEIYHNSNSIDKFKGPVKLNKGDNQILIKVCQNEQTESWAQDWQFQLRICDETGKAISETVSSSQEN